MRGGILKNATRRRYNVRHAVLLGFNFRGKFPKNPVNFRVEDLPACRLRKDNGWRADPTLALRRDGYLLFVSPTTPFR